MSRFQDPYLAESVGFSTGHSSGIAEGVAVGRQQGYTDGLNDGYTKGWNAAAEDANKKLSQKDKQIEDLNRKSIENTKLLKEEIEKIDIDRKELSQLIFSLSDRVKELFEKNKELINELNIKNAAYTEEIEKISSERSEEQMAFLGVISIARAAMKFVATLSIEEKNEFVKEYANIATELQTSEYIEKNRFPHNQNLVSQHIPDISKILKDNIFPQARSYRDSQKISKASKDE